MKIILDSNVIISALTTQGLSSRVLDLCIDKHLIFTSSWILDEVTRILSNKFKIESNKLTRIRNFLQSATLTIEQKGKKPAHCRDEDDNNILHLAKHVHANLIITGDVDLLIMKTYEDIKIITPRQFMEHYFTPKT
ncbi:MAG: putative toxin-antitoxin system toxin component, PIN family [Candidatus Cloacimonetes bacterium]|nr:putative toxin-antitoxin system toxin component, PIN family [Candidatus Cloacimonadota bacterium]